MFLFFMKNRLRVALSQVKRYLTVCASGATDMNLNLNDQISASILNINF